MSRPARLRSSQDSLHDQKPRAGVILALSVASLGAMLACGPRGDAGARRAPAANTGKGAGATLQPVEIGDDGLKPGLAPADAALAARVKEKLAADPRLHGMRLEVDAQGGRVTLWGQVDDRAARSVAEQLARQTSGVRSLSNLLDVRGAPPPASPLGGGAR
jgi:osmotically-inducible protein OsmY